MLSIKNKDT